VTRFNASELSADNQPTVGPPSAYWLMVGHAKASQRPNQARHGRIILHQTQPTFIIGCAGAKLQCETILQFSYGAFYGV